MIYEIKITEQAEADLRGIYEYIAFELLSPDNAAGQLDRLEKNIIELEEFPHKFRAYDKEPWHSRGMRVMPVNNYLGFYVPDDEARTVTVLRVLYDGRDTDIQLSRYTKMNNNKI